MKRAMLMAYSFVLMHWAAVLGLYHFLRGSRDIWHRHRPVEGVWVRSHTNRGAH
jgi:uncharacterized BrkB/YihY/UPF0761 family membrane protein